MHRRHNLYPDVQASAVIAEIDNFSYNLVRNQGIIIRSVGLWLWRNNCNLGYLIKYWEERGVR